MLSMWRTAYCSSRRINTTVCEQLGQLVNLHAQQFSFSTWMSARCTCIFQKNMGSLQREENMLLSFSKMTISSKQSYCLRWMTTTINSGELILEDSAIASTENVHPHPPQIKFKRLDKTARNIMNILNKEAVENVQSKREIPDIRPGYIIQLKVEVPENKRRVSTVKGIVIARRNAGIHTTFRLRRLVAGVGVESVYPLYSPNIKEITVLDKKKKVRRAKLYYLRDRMNALKK